MRLYLPDSENVIYIGEEVVVTYEDPTSGDDEAAVQDRSGNDAGSFTTGQGDVPAVTNISKKIDPRRLTTAVSLARAYILETDAPGTSEDERITTVRFEVSNEGSLPDAPLWTVTFGGSATYGSDYTVSPADSDPNTDGHQVQGSSTEKAIEITITARADSTPNEAEQIQMTAEVEVGGHEHRFTSRRLRIFEAIDAVVIRVADARAEEGVDETVDFRVYLDRPAFTTLTVDYETSDGTAVAGQDYAAKSGRLTFEEGDTEQTIPVRILDDAVDEGEETFTLTLSNAVGARIADATAIATIANDDALQKAWLARFGRTVGSQAVDAVTGRLEGAPASEVSIGGRSLTGGGDTSTLAEAKAHARASAMTRWLRGEEEEIEDPKALSARDVLLGSHFNLSAGGEAGAPRYNAWGRFATGAFEGEDGDVKLSGEVTSGFLGADIEAGRWLGGVAVGLSEGEGPFALTGSATSTRREGTLESSLIAAYPYLRLRATERLSLWGMGGFGSGTMTVTQEDDPGIETDISMRMGALGVIGAVLEAPPDGGLAVNVKSDVLHVGMESDAVTSAEGNMEGAEADVTRYRLILEGAMAYALAGEATLTPAFEVGLRHDAGDAETGTGLEVGARIAYARPGMTIGGAARTLVAHADSGYEEWGASASVRIDPGESGRGLSLTLTPALGATGSASERLWGLSDTAGLAGDREFEAGRRLETELGYGLRAPVGVVTPFAGLGLADESRTLRLGTRWRLDPTTSMHLEGVRSGSSDDAEHRVGLAFSTRW